jgi:hypothetical protein
MKRNLQINARIIFTIFTTILSSWSYAATYTATASGNWSNAATWGGTAPGFTIQTDNVVIPSGITVNLDGDLTINGLLAELNVNGTLTSSSSDLLMTTGAVNGSGAVVVDNAAFGPLSSLAMTGSFTANTMSTAIISLQTTSSMTINNMLTLAGVLQLNTGGSLSIGNNANIVLVGGRLVNNGGSLLLTNNYNVTYSGSANMTAGAELLGSGLRNVTVDVGASNALTLMDDLDVKGILTLTSGRLDLNDQHLTISGDLASSGDGSITTSAMSDITLASAASITGTLRLSNQSNTVNNLTVNIGASNQASISGDLIVNGNLALTSGILHLQNSNLNIAGNISDGGTAFISTTGNSDIEVSTATAPSGSLRFMTGTAVDDLTVNITNGGNVMLASNLMVNGTLDLNSGKLDIGNNTLTIGSSGSISGYNSNSYIITGVTGSVAMGLTTASSTSTVFPVGTANLYFPAAVKLNTGSNSGMVMVGVMPNIYANGTSGTDISLTRRAVDATWNIQSDISSNLNMNLQLMWNAAAEVNSFDRTACYISHYTSGSWDASAVMAAGTQGSMYTVTRANITSLSPFAVFEDESSSIAEHGTLTLTIYPNPSHDFLFIGNLHHATTLDIMNANGQVITTASLDGEDNSIAIKELPAGIYFIKVEGAVYKFTKM